MRRLLIFCLGWLLLSGGWTPVAAATVSPPISRTFEAHLKTAPYPYDGPYGDTRQPFYDEVQGGTGKRFHTNRYGQRFEEHRHYADDRVLFHLSPGFDVARPFVLFVFFHPLATEISRYARGINLLGQIDAAGKNCILVMPQLALNALDASPGKFFTAGAGQRFLDEVADLLADRLGKEHRSALGKAPVVLAGFSGGYKAISFLLDRGGITRRVRAVLLLDALYEDVGKFQNWLLERFRSVSFLFLYGPGTCAKHASILRNALRQHRLPFEGKWPGVLSRGVAAFVPTSVPHPRVPVDGPPIAPLTAFLSRLVIP